MTSSKPVTGPSAARRRSRRLVINRAPEPSEVQRRLESDRRRYSVGIVDPDQFASELAVEFARRHRNGRNCAVASISLFEIPGINHRHGPLYVFDLITELVTVLQQHLDPNDVFHVAENGDVLILGRDAPVADTFDLVQRLCMDIAGRRWDADGEALLLTPSAGLATLDDGRSASEVVRRAIDAREVASGHLDLRVHRWEPAMSLDTAPPERESFDRFGWQRFKERMRAPTQIAATYVLGLLVPFMLYWFLDQIVGVDITWAVYVLCVLALVSTGAMILVEARLAIRQKEPPAVDHYPDASAIICAYLPNEASTILDTLDAFLSQGYPGNLQVILAYNTPSPMPVERELHRLSDAHPNLDVVKVEGSTSKAQNVNAVLHLATGEFTGMFDADHMPRPGSFERAWRWLANGYDVVQGHCLTRNGEETWLARMVAVEFESIYAVAHPGRARLHRFGVVGGSNGYWKTDVLHETRMRGSMLTEDVDSSMRTVERGLKIRSDRDLVSRELGTTTMRQVWNQRLRWAQGWFQVAKMHTARVWRSPGLTLRQKFGATYLLSWREVYPWLSLQVIPLVAYWYIVRGQTLSTGWPILFFTTLFVLHVGPHQTWYAYKLADPEIKQHKSWFWGYLAFSTLFYTEYKNTITRVAHVKEFVGERAWKVTPRSDAPIEFGDDVDDLLAEADTDDANDANDASGFAASLTAEDGEAPFAYYESIDDHEPRRVRGAMAADLARADAPSSAATEEADQRGGTDPDEFWGDRAGQARARPALRLEAPRAAGSSAATERSRTPESARLADAMVLPPVGSAVGVPLLSARPATRPTTDRSEFVAADGPVVRPADDWYHTHTGAALDAIRASLAAHATAALDAIDTAVSVSGLGTAPGPDGGELPVRRATGNPVVPSSFDMPSRGASSSRTSGDRTGDEAPNDAGPHTDADADPPGVAVDDSPTLPLRRPRTPG